MTGIDKASTLAAAVVALNTERYGAPEDVQMNVTIDISNSIVKGRTAHARVLVTRRYGIEGDAAVRIIQIAKGLGATSAGIESTGGIYARFTDS